MTQITLPPNLIQCPLCGGIQDKFHSECGGCGINIKFMNNASQPRPDAPARMAVANALMRLIPFDSKGVLAGRVYLTPPEVFKFPALGKTVGVLYEHELDGYTSIPDQELVHTFYWKKNSDKKGQGRYITYLPILPLGKCLTCQKPATRYDVVQSTIVRGHPRFSMAGVSQEVVNQISTAWGMDRYWIPAPFCSVHGMDKGCSVEVTLEENRKIIKTTDPFLSQAIAEKYGVPAKAGNIAQRTRFGGGIFSIFASIVFLMINGATLIEKLRDAGWNFNLFLKDNIFPNILGLLIGVGLMVLAIKWLRVKPSAVIPIPASAVSPAPSVSDNPRLQTQGSNPIQPQPDQVQDPVEQAIKELTFISTARAEHLQMIKVLKDSSDPQAIRALISAMFTGNNQSGKAYGNNEPFARSLELQAFRALINKEPQLVDEDLKRVYSRQDTAERKAEMIQAMGDGQDARSVQLIFELAGTGYLRDGEKDAYAFYHTLAGIAAKNPELIQPYLAHGRVDFQNYAKTVLDIVSANRAFQKVYASLDHVNRQSLQKELNLPALSIPSPSIILKAVSQVNDLPNKPSAWQCVVALKTPKVVDNLYDLLHSDHPYTSALAGDLLRQMVDRQVITQLMDRFEQKPTPIVAETLGSLLGQWTDPEAAGLLGKVFRLSPSPAIVKIISQKGTDPENLNGIIPDLEAVFQSTPTLDNALLLAELGNLQPIQYLLTEIKNEADEKHFHNRDDESGAQNAFLNRVKTKSDALTKLIRKNGSLIPLDALKDIAMMEDPVFTSHYYAMIDSEETEFVEKKKADLSELRKAAQAELENRGYKPVVEYRQI